MKGGGLTNERTDERTDERKSPCVLQDFVPLGAAAQKRLEGMKDDGSYFARSTKIHIFLQL